MRSSSLFGLSLGALTLVPAFTAHGADATPDFSGYWARRTFAFELPASGQGPIGRLGQRANTGNYNSPLLTPYGARIVKERTETLLGGEAYPNPSLDCWPMVAPYVFRVQELQVIRKKDEILFIFMQDHQVRRVRLNAEHPAQLSSSWQGDSIGHFEGDALVVDTIGHKTGPFPIIDMYASPFSEALHVVERYRLIPYEDAKEAQEKNIRDSGPVATEQAAFVDESYRGPGLEIQFTVEDKNVFTAPWSAKVTLRKAGGWVENVCAENPFEYYNNRISPIPIAEKPDF
jgi:hypothetical protein